MSDESSRLPTEFRERLDAARESVAEARAGSDKFLLAEVLKLLADVQRRSPLMAEDAVATLTEAANLYQDVSLPLEQAWCLRHIGIVREYQELLEEAGRYFDEALRLYREHSSKDDLNYANAVRYPAVIKNRLGQREESRELWEEACRRYEGVDEGGLSEGVAEAAAWLTIFAVEEGDIELAEQWFAKANKASSASGDSPTRKFIDEVRSRLEMARV